MPISSLKYLAKISYNDVTFITETVDVFIENTPKEINKLHIAANNQQLEEVSNAAHALKSSLKVMDMQNAYQLCLILENEAKEGGSINIIVEHIELIEKECKQAYKELKAALNTL